MAPPPPRRPRCRVLLLPIKLGAVVDLREQVTAFQRSMHGEMQEHVRRLDSALAQLRETTNADLAVLRSQAEETSGMVKQASSLQEQATLARQEQLLVERAEVQPELQRCMILKSEMSSLQHQVALQKQLFQPGPTSLHVHG